MKTFLPQLQQANAVTAIEGGSGFQLVKQEVEESLRDLAYATSEEDEEQFKSEEEVDQQIVFVRHLNFGH